MQIKFNFRQRKLRVRARLFHLKALTLSQRPTIDHRTSQARELVLSIDRTRKLCLENSILCRKMVKFAHMRCRSTAQGVSFSSLFYF